MMYKGRLIEESIYTGGKYTVNYHGDEILFDSIEGAMEFIDELIEEDCL